ncbi:unnamed protein product [Zymoseptoria tritici ST99CH_3D7]|uniref:AAA+ ATPase domain-containing protein n=1 Tax=Zymoseptoria tritici (strain ST99CH_3D7) TaxID=1276538 RepID=A0A1X7RBW1_ZYMT9|nr:unnamed protein product [Zymoseptoria tritici ST99CH_3D7]
MAAARANESMMDDSGWNSHNLASLIVPKFTSIAQQNGSTTTDNATGKSAAAPTVMPIDPEDVGKTLGLKQLYSGSEDIHGRYQWTTELPKDLEVPGEDADSAKWALILRRTKAYFDSQKTLELHSIVVQSPYLRELLGEILADYPGVTTTLKRLEFKGRFEPLIHRWSQLKTAITQLKVEQSKRSDPSPSDCARIEHAELLDNVLTKEFSDVLASINDMHDNGVVTYEHLWALLEPNSLIYTKHDSQDRAMHVKSCKYGKDPMTNADYLYVTANFVDFDGQRFGMNRLTLKIAEFEGTQPITALPAYPLQYHEDSEQLQKSLIERGGRVEDFASPSFCQYSGVGWTLDHNGNKVQMSVQGRVVIDAGGFNKFNPNLAVHVSPFKDSTTDAGNDPFLEEVEQQANYGASKSSQVKRMQKFQRQYTNMRNLHTKYSSVIFSDNHDAGNMPIDGSLGNDVDVSDLPPLTDEQKMLLGPEIRGYALKEKMWLTFFVNAVSDISFSEGAFDSLILPDNLKDLVLSFTSSQNHNFDDVIRGKGKGIIFLLCGPPGVGKTLTAESVAERMQVPLYVMSSGDLGTDPSAVDHKLRNVLEMCTRWNAILLLDEADVFLEKRSLHELERNKLVTIFLRVMEYYEGIMFLTTNRVETFDQAFQSRIHIQLEYKDLDAASRLSVWNNFLTSHNAAQAAARLSPPPKAPTTAAKSRGSARALNKCRTNSAAPSAANGTTISAEAEAADHLLRTQPHALKPSEVRKLAELAINGREIKTLVKLAAIYAAYKKEALSKAHLATAVETQFLGNSRREKAIPDTLLNGVAGEDEWKGAWKRSLVRIWAYMLPDALIPKWSTPKKAHVSKKGKASDRVHEPGGLDVPELDDADLDKRYGVRIIL